MKFSKVITLVLSISLIIGISLPLAVAATRDVDGSSGEWMGIAPGAVNSGTASNNEWIWNDNTGDQRTSLSGSDNSDLTEFRVTADSENIYFLAKVSDMTDANYPHIQVAIDKDLDGSGNSVFQQELETSPDLGVDGDAEWENLMKFSTEMTRVIDNDWGEHKLGTSYFSTSNNTIEASVPISALGITWPDDLRFTVATFEESAASDNAMPTNITDVDAFDVITDVSGNTWNEVSDNADNYYFEVSFESDGDVAGPVSVAENSAGMYVTVSPLAVQPSVQITSIDDNVDFGSLTEGESQEAVNNPFAASVRGDNVPGVDVYLKGTDMTNGGLTIGADNIEHQPADGSGSWSDLQKSYAPLRENLENNMTLQIEENFQISVPSGIVSSTNDFSGTLWIRAQDNTLSAP